ncbi:hypothetical protein Cgig2_020042 [Carnegiea gigantea]|uniref:Uncharacterized protein n=1 Tax=Carnegiea gigantea TaxID=171969 RepID=A0A9Q1GS89_9CARY|nr:hypothetical protein Cgig2_020042 [Carnegiea gigantea]
MNGNPYIAPIGSNLVMRKKNATERIKSEENEDLFSRGRTRRHNKRKQASYIYSILNKHRVRVNSFDKVPEITIKVNLERKLTKATKDIKEVMFSIPNNNSPAPYGFISGFFKATSLLSIGIRELMKLIRRFHMWFESMHVNKKDIQGQVGEGYYREERCIMGQIDPLKYIKGKDWWEYSPPQDYQEKILQFGAARSF